jgi:hypothetical protein
MLLHVTLAFYVKLSDEETVGIPENSIFITEHIGLLCRCAEGCLDALSWINYLPIRRIGLTLFRAI